MTEEPPRLKHNRVLKEAYLASFPAPPRFPKVANQIECVPLAIGSLFPRGYNPAILDDGDGILMAYRYHTGGMNSLLAIARISDNGEVASNQPLNTPGHSVEDPKLFRLQGGEFPIWASWVEAYWPVKPLASVRLGTLKEGYLAESARPDYGQNDGEHMEKNWVFFEHGGAIYFIYQSQPKQVIVRWSGQMEAEHVTDGPRWPWGAIKGGTPPLPYNGKLLRFFHSTLDNEIEGHPRRYYLGACLMNPEPPFETVEVSRKPIVYGSEDDNLTPDERKSCCHWKGKVVFPGGAVMRGDHWIVSVGVNDSECMLLKVKPENLNL